MQRCNVATLENLLYLCREIFSQGWEYFLARQGEYFFEARRLLLQGQENTSPYILE